MVYITFNRYKQTPGGVRDIEASTTLGPFDWVEVEVPVLIAEAENGKVRHDQLAVLYTQVGNYHWRTKDGQQWHDFVISACEG